MASSSGTPNIGVNLTATGLQNVVNAFRKVREEGAGAGKGAAAGVNLISASLETLRDLLPALSAAVVIERVVGGVVELALSARETAENIGKLSEKTGASVGTLSALNLVAHDSEVEFEAFSKGLIKIAENQNEATSGSQKQLLAFKSIGISLNDLKTLDPGQIFVKLAEGMAAATAGAEKTDLAKIIGGKIGPELIPMLNALGTEGFDKVVEKAKRFGVYLDQDLVDQARAAQDAVHKLEDIAAGFGTNIVRGFAAPITTAIDGVAESFMNLSGGKDDFTKWGLVAGEAILAVAENFAELDRSIETSRADLLYFRSLLTNPIDVAIAHLSPVKAVRQQAQAGVDKNQQDIIESTRIIGEAQKNYDQTLKRLADTRAKLYAPPGAPSAPPTPGLGGKGKGKDLEQLKKEQEEADKLKKAKSEYLQSQADNQLAIQKLTNQLAEAEDKRSYEAGLLTVDAYYDKVEARAKDEAAAELAILERKRKDANDLPTTTKEQDYKRLQEVAKIDAQITELGLKSTGDLAQAEDERTKAKHDNAIKELEDEEKLARAAGNTRAAEEIGLALEIQQYTELLNKRQELSAEDKKKLIDRYSTQGNARIAYNQNQKDASKVSADYGSAIDLVDAQVGSGQISVVAGETEKLQFQQEEIEKLKAIGAQMEINAELSGNEDAIDAANKFNNALVVQEQTLRHVTTAQTYLINQFSTQGVSALSDFFSAGISGSKSFGDALGDFASSFENIIAKMISQLLVFYALQEVLGLFNVDSSTITSIIGATPFSKGFAGGGWTGGTAGKPAGVVHGEEFVVKAGPAAANRPWLEALNAGVVSPPAIRSISSTSSVASDYAASISGDASAAPVVQVINTTGQPTQQKQTTGAGGKSLTQIIVGVMRQDVASGGDFAKQMEGQYGLARGGTRRG